MYSKKDWYRLLANYLQLKVWRTSRLIIYIYSHVSFIRSSVNSFFVKLHAFAWERTWYIINFFISLIIQASISAHHFGAKTGWSPLYYASIKPFFKKYHISWPCQSGRSRHIFTHAGYCTANLQRTGWMSSTHTRTSHIILIVVNTQLYCLIFV